MPKATLFLLLNTSDGNHDVLLKDEEMDFLPPKETRVILMEKYLLNAKVSDIRMVLTKNESGVYTSNRQFWIYVDSEPIDRTALPSYRVELLDEGWVSHDAYILKHQK